MASSGPGPDQSSDSTEKPSSPSTSAPSNANPSIPSQPPLVAGSQPEGPVPPTALVQQAVRTVDDFARKRITQDEAVEVLGALLAKYPGALPTYLTLLKQEIVDLSAGQDDIIPRAESARPKADN